MRLRSGPRVTPNPKKFGEVEAMAAALLVVFSAILSSIKCTGSNSDFVWKKTDVLRCFSTVVERFQLLSARASVVLLWCFLSGGAAVASSSDADRYTDVYFAGIAFTGSLDTAEQAFPYAESIIHDASRSAAFREAFSAGFSRSPPVALTIRNDLARLDGTTSAIVLAAAIDRETVVVEQIGDQYKILVEIAGNALFFDFREKMVIASRALTLQHTDLSDVVPDQARIAGIVEQLLTGSDNSAFVPNFVEIVQGIRIPQASSRRMQVAEVHLDETAIAALTGPGRTADALQQTLGHEFTKIFGDRQQISLLPFRKGAAIGREMSARFADGRVYMLTIPEPDYVISIKVGPLKSKVVQQTAVASNTLYGGYFHVTVAEPLSGKRYFEHELRQGSTKTTPLTQISVDHAAAHYENLLVGFDAFASAINDKRSNWIRNQVNPRPLAKELQSLSDLVRTCR